MKCTRSRRELEFSIMKTLTPYTKSILGIVALLVSAKIQAADPTPADRDQAKLQGEWEMVSVQRDGADIAAVPDSKRICKGDETTVTIGGQMVLKAKFALKPDAKPKAIDYSISEGPMAGQKMLGIYELDGDTAKFCF